MKGRTLPRRQQSLADFKEIARARAGGEGREEFSVADRAEAFMASRRGPNGTSLGDIYAKALAQRRMLPAGTPGGPGSVNWTPLGPSGIPFPGSYNASGRITSIAVGPGGNRIYAGSANGGVWISTDGGSNWAPLNDYIVSPGTSNGGVEADALSVGAMAVRFGAGSNPMADELFIGTGEANGNYDAYYGEGIRHLVSGSWTLEATDLAGRAVYDVLIDPNDATPTNIYAATSAGIYKRPIGSSPTTWGPRVTSPAFLHPTAAVSSFIAAGTGAGRTFYAAFYTGLYSTSTDGVYSSPNGTTWTALSGLSTHMRIVLAASESSPGVVYALVGDGTIWRLNGTTFSQVTGLPADAIFADPPTGQGWYDIAIAVHPTDPNTIIVGGDAYALFKGTVSGGPGSYVFPFNAANAPPGGNPASDPTWVGSGVHSDVHAVEFGLNASGSSHDASDVWVGSDGGMFHSATGGAAGSFSAKNLGLAITQFSYLAQRSDTDAALFAGAQDNGTPRLLSEEAGVDHAGGDGGGVAFDPGVEPGSAYRVLRQEHAASLYASSDGGASWTGINFPPMTAATAAQQSAANTETDYSHVRFAAPLRAAASGSTSLAAFGTHRLWLTQDWGASWATLPTNTNPYAPATPDLNQDAIGGGPVTAIAFASTSKIYAATPSTIWRYDLAGTTWTKTVLPTTGLPGFVFFTAVAPDLDPAAAPNSLYATLGGGGVAHLYYFNGTTWTAAMGTSVVDVPSHAVAVDPVAPTNVYVGTDVGCFKGVKTGATSWNWQLFSQGLPESAITDLVVFAPGPAPARLLRAATHGRGVWEIDLAATAGADPDIYLRLNYNDSGRMTAAGTRAAWTSGHLDPTHVGYRLYQWHCADIKVRRSSLTGLPPLSSPTTFFDYAINIGDYTDTVTQMQTGDLSGTDTIYVEVHNRSLTAVPAAQVSVLLLAVDASATVPALPAGWASRVNSLDTTNWLSGTPWQFVDPMMPYRQLPRDIDARTPQVVSYQLDFSSLGLPAGHDHVCLAAFITTPNDPIPATLTTTDLGQANLTDKHVAHRNIHLVALGSRPSTVPGGAQPHSRTFYLDFHNPTDKEAAADFVFDREFFPGRLSLMLPRLPQLHEPAGVLHGFRVHQFDEVEVALERAAAERLEKVGEWLEELGEALQQDGEAVEKDGADRDPRRIRYRRDKVRSVDHARVYVAEAGVERPTLRGMRIPAGGVIRAAMTVQLPPGAEPGTVYRLDAMQRQGDTVLGGSTYVILVTRPPKT